jgi:maleamate amidohydrolase
MTERIWDRFLTEQDRALVASDARARARLGIIGKPALLLIDLYRWVFGDRPEPLLEAVRTWPGSCGLDGWRALPNIQRLLAVAREVGIPVIHATGMHEVPGWSEPGQPGDPDSPEAREHRKRKYEIVDDVAPIEGEVVLRKSSPSAFWGTPLVGYLRRMGIDTLIVAGETTSGCVRATVVDGCTSRYQIVVVEECVFDRTEASHAINLFDMDQKYADVLSLTEVIDDLQGLAGKPLSRPALGVRDSN